MNHRIPLLIGCVWGMETAWLFAAAAFITTAAFGTPFPLSDAAAASLGAMLFTALARRFCPRPIQFIGLHMLGFGAVCLHLIYRHQASGLAFFNRYWLVEFLNQPKTLLVWLSLSTAACFLLFFWMSGFRIMTRPKDIWFVRNRFDLGVGIFVSVFLIELLVIVKTGTRLKGLTTHLQIFPFFIFGMLAFTLVRSSGQGQRRFVMGYRGMGAVLSFAAATLLAGTGLTVLFLPQLTRSAEIGVDLIKTAARPLEPVVVSILLFLFGHRRTAAPAPDMPEGSLAPALPALVGGPESLLWQAVGWGFVGLVTVLVLGLLLVVIWRLVRWLFAGQPGHGGASGSGSLFRDLVQWVRRAVSSLIQRVAAWIRGPRTAVQLYTLLIRWGHFSGLPLLTSETPLEYASRLGARFPFLKGHIQLIIDAHSEMVYGPAENSLNGLTAARAALRALRNPVHWPARCKSLFLH